MTNLVESPQQPTEADLFAQIADEHGSALSAVRSPRPDYAHLLLANGEVLVVRFAADRSISRVFTPSEYAQVDLSQVRDPRVAALWDVHAGWENQAS